MENNAKKCVERYCELASKTTQQSCKVATPYLDDHHFRDEENGSVGKLTTVLLTNCSEICIWIVLVDTILCGLCTNSLVRSQNRQVCDMRLVRLISYIHHTCALMQYWYVGNNTTMQIRIVSGL